MFSKMKAAMLFVALVAFLAIGLTAVAEDSAGKTIFLANKCNTCHTIDSAQIEKLSGKKSEKGPPDLSAVGSKHTADWITKYLMKEVEQNGKKHMKQFTGKPEDLKTLASWLETLKEKGK